MEKSKERQNGTGRRCAETSNPGVTKEHDHNPLNVIRNIVSNETRNQWPHEFAVKT